MIRPDYVHRPHSSIDFRMATYRRPVPGWYRLCGDIATGVMYVLAVVTVMAFLYAVAPPY